MIDLDTLQQRFDEVEPRLRAFLDEPGRFQRIRNASPPQGPLAGFAFAVKDIINVDGLPTRCGSALPPNLFAGPQATCVTRLLGAGAVMLGKTVTTEFAYYETGPTTNPHNENHTPGGSSSGSAAAVAAGLCDFALGSQTQGSVIRPAAFCGCVGFKPTFDRIPIDGVLPFSPSVDTLGLFTRDTMTARHVATTLLTDWRDIMMAQSLPRLAVPRGPYLDHVKPAAMQSFESTLAQLRDAGFRILDVEAMPDFGAMADRHRDLIAAEVAQVHQDWYPQYGHLYRPKSKAIVEQGKTISPQRIDECRDSLTALRDHLESLMQEHRIDGWLSPAAPGTAPYSLDSTGDPVMNIPWTHAHMPAITLPTDRIGGLPLGLQIASRHHTDEMLLAWSRTLEATLSRRPPASDQSGET